MASIIPAGDLNKPAPPLNTITTTTTAAGQLSPHHPHSGTRDQRRPSTNTRLVIDLSIYAARFPVLPPTRPPSRRAAVLAAMLHLFRPMRQLVAARLPILRPLAPSTLASPSPASQALTLQRVSVHRQKYGSRANRFLAAAAFTYCAYTIYDRIILGPIADYLDSEDESPSAGEEMEEGDVMGLFIPIPLTIKACEPQPYAEGREGDSSAKDVDRSRFSLQGPPEYEQTGFFISLDFIGIGDRMVESDTAKLTERVFWPAPIALSSWAFLKTLVKEQTSRVGRFIGLDVAGDEPAGARVVEMVSPPTSSSDMPASQQAASSSNTDLQKAIDRIRQQATKRPEEVKDPRSMGSPVSSASSTQNSPNAPNAPSSPTSPGKEAAAAAASGGTATTSSGDKGERPSNDRFPGEGDVRSFIGNGPWQAFFKKLKETYKPIRLDPPRGCVLVSGLVEIDTPKAIVIIDVFAWYDPKRKTYDERSMHMSLRRMQFKRQAPLR
ncbi:hypothetical protein B0T17DRAFT_616775 [Bombardia bombarda]|uniref:Uncharacterized protein n=1 Tax=Bombardia bombarda TaxID=252184 RepID=A0AA40C4A4_9PEZI|nr:hypothetical protein B0T17DRAFT_616775 [Bombardia bombarda]